MERHDGGYAMRHKLFRRLWIACAVGLFLAGWLILIATAHAQQQKPNILVIMGDDVGWFNIGAYHRGIMAGRTPNLDQLAADGIGQSARGMCAQVAASHRTTPPASACMPKPPSRALPETIAPNGQ